MVLFIRNDTRQVRKSKKPCHLIANIPTTVSNLVARFLPSGTSRFTIPQVSEADAIEFPFLADLPKREDWPAELAAEVDAYVADFKEHDGLLIQKACPALLGVSRQRFHQLVQTYNFQKFEHFESTWYSRKQLQKFASLHRDAASFQNGTSDAIRAQFAS